MTWLYGYKAWCGALIDHAARPSACSVQQGGTEPAATPREPLVSIKAEAPIDKLFDADHVAYFLGRPPAPNHSELWAWLPSSNPRLPAATALTGYPDSDAVKPGKLRANLALNRKVLKRHCVDKPKCEAPEVSYVVPVDFEGGGHGFSGQPATYGILLTSGLPSQSSPLVP